MSHVSNILFYNYSRYYLTEIMVNVVLLKFCCKIIKANFFFSPGMLEVEYVERSSGFFFLNIRVFLS